jgi:predicted O-methyltransferase YrrM
MNDFAYFTPPATLHAIEADTQALGFSMASETRTGALLRTLAASTRGNRHVRLLELGTGTGIATAWLLDGMDAASQLDTVENDETPLLVARRHLGHDVRVRFHLADGAAFLAQAEPQSYDLIFADAWPGKFSELNQALALLKPGGFYVIDDLLPQPNWPEDHAPKVPRLIETLAQRPDLTLCPLAWSSGLVIAVKTT